MGQGCLRPVVESNGQDGDPTDGQDGARVTLSVYDVFGDSRVKLANDIFRPLGGGAFHAGVVVFGQEWSFGALQDGDGTGVFCCEPGTNPDHRFREAVPLGVSRLSEDEAAEALERLQKQWPGRAYDLVNRNCCHFCSALAEVLGVRPPPAWVTRLLGGGAPALRALATASEAVQLVQDSWNSTVIALQCVRAQGFELESLQPWERCIPLHLSHNGTRAVGPRHQPDVFARLAPWAADMLWADHLFEIAWDAPCLYVKKPPKGVLLVNGVKVKYETFVLLKHSELSFCTDHNSRSRIAFRLIRDFNSDHLRWAVAALGSASKSSPLSSFACRTETWSACVSEPLRPRQLTPRSDAVLAKAQRADDCQGPFQPL